MRSCLLVGLATHSLLRFPSAGWPLWRTVVPFGMENTTGAWLLDVEKGKSAREPRSGLEALSWLPGVNDWVLGADCIEAGGERETR